FKKSGSQRATPYCSVGRHGRAFFSRLPDPNPSVPKSRDGLLQIRKTWPRGVLEEAKNGIFLRPRRRKSKSMRELGVDISRGGNASELERSEGTSIASADPSKA